MRVGPTDGGLDNIVQSQQGRGERDVNTSPEGRIEFAELDSDACDGLNHEEGRVVLFRYSVTGLSG